MCAKPLASRPATAGTQVVHPIFVDRVQGRWCRFRRVKSLLLVALSLTACASAEPTGTAVDAAVGGRVDAAPRTDAAADAFVTPSDAAGVNPNCSASMTCTNGMMLGMVSGDTGAGMLTATGFKAAWYKVRVTEDYSDAPGLALRLAATLMQPAAGSFDVFVYVNPTSDTIECNTTTGTATTMGNSKEVRAEWGEGFFPNGADDSRDVVIEVRPAAGTSCASSQTWSLRIDGNWL
jgi:hypothetical protein